VCFEKVTTSLTLWPLRAKEDRNQNPLGGLREALAKETPYRDVVQKMKSIVGESETSSFRTSLAPITRKRPLVVGGAVADLFRTGTEKTGKVLRGEKKFKRNALGVCNTTAAHQKSFRSCIGQEKRNGLANTKDPRDTTVIGKKSLSQKK